MNTLQLQHIPGVIRTKYKSRHKQRSAILRRPFPEEGRLPTKIYLAGKVSPHRPSLMATRFWLEQHMWTLPVLDHRGTNEILGYGDDGLCH